METTQDRKTYRDEKDRWITEDSRGVKFVSDEHGQPLKDEEGFVTYVGNFGL